MKLQLWKYDYYMIRSEYTNMLRLTTFWYDNFQIDMKIIIRCPTPFEFVQQYWVGATCGFIELIIFQSQYELDLVSVTMSVDKLKLW